MAESKSTYSALFFNDHSEKLAKFHSFSINGLGGTLGGTLAMIGEFLEVHHAVTGK
jgi:hypothetical protein